MCSLAGMDHPAAALSSLIFTLSADPELAASALQTLRCRSDVELAEGGGRWVPAVLEAADPYGAVREMERIPGVDLVEVVFVELDEARSVSAGATADRR